MDRRSFVTGLAVGGAVGAGAASLLTKPKEVIKEVEVVKEVAAPAIAAERVEIAMVATWDVIFLVWEQVRSVLLKSCQT